MISRGIRSIRPPRILYVENDGKRGTKKKERRKLSKSKSCERNKEQPKDT